MKLTEFVAMTDTIRLATNKALDAGNQFSTPWRVIGRLTGVLENALYALYPLIETLAALHAWPWGADTTRSRSLLS